MEIAIAADGAEASRSNVSTERGTTCIYEPETGNYRARFEGDFPRPSERVIDVLAAVAATDPVDLPPLFEAVDPDALDALVCSSESDGDTLCVSFAYDDHDVTVTA